jgi:hypothetical protein
VSQTKNYQLFVDCAAESKINIIIKMANFAVQKSFFNALQDNSHDLISQILNSNTVNINDKIILNIFLDQNHNHSFLSLALLNYYHFYKTPNAQKYVKTIEVLLQAGADVNLCFRLYNNVRFLLDSFGIESSLDILDLFISFGVDVNTTCDRNKTSLFYLASNQIIKVRSRTRKSMYLLLCNGANLYEDIIKLQHKFLSNEWPILELLYCFELRSLHIFF